MLSQVCLLFVCFLKKQVLGIIGCPSPNYIGKAGFKLDPPASVSWVWGLLVYATSSLIFLYINKHFNFSLSPMTLMWDFSHLLTFSAKLDILLVCPGLGLRILLHSIHPNSGRGGFLLTGFYISVSSNDHTSWITTSYNHLPSSIVIIY